LRFIPHYVRFVRSIAHSLYRAIFSRPIPRAPGPLRGCFIAVHRRTRRFATHPEARDNEARGERGNGRHPRCAALPIAPSLHFLCIPNGTRARMPSCLYRSDVNRSPIVITDRSFSLSLSLSLYSCFYPHRNPNSVQRFPRGRSAGKK